jgi:ribosomal protein S18 acetylase RimI-like enzyme
MSLRPLRPEDADACVAVIRTLPDFFGYEPGVEQAAMDLRKQAGWVAEADGAVVGFATWAPRTEATAEITWMAVEGGRRRQGIGTAVLERLIGTSRSAASGSLWP